MKDYGLKIPDYIQPEEWMLGAKKLGDKPLTDGHWSKYLPEMEWQAKNGLETYNCTAFGTLNAIEMIMKVKFGLDANYSDRAVGILAGTDLGGNNPHTVADVIRKKGLINESLLPFSNELLTINDYYKPKPLPKNLLKEAERWTKGYSFNHAWLFYPMSDLKHKQKQLMEALPYSPVGVSVSAWYRRSDGGGERYYKPTGERDNHWTLLCDYIENDAWLVWDSYDGYLKILDWDYDFELAKTFQINKLEGKVGLFERFYQFIMSLYAK